MVKIKVLRVIKIVSFATVEACDSDHAIEIAEKLFDDVPRKTRTSGGHWFTEPEGTVSKGFRKARREN